MNIDERDQAVAAAVIVAPAPRDHTAIIDALVRAERTPLQLAADFGLSLAELLDVADDPMLDEQVRRMCKLNHDHARLLLSQFSGTATVALLRLAGKEQEESPPEVARKSCVDLLEQSRAIPAGTTGMAGAAAVAPAGAISRTGASASPASTAVTTSAGAPNGPRAPSEEAILRALELLDRQHENEPQQPWLAAPPEGKLEPRMNTDEREG